MKKESNKVLIIDNYDSFTYNIAQYVSELGATAAVFRNNEITITQITEYAPSRIIISPGPCTPLEAGISNEVITAFSGKMPILGVCLGHQCIGYVFGSKIVRASRIMHGKTSSITHTEEGIFKGLKNPFEATRYHSLAIERSTISKELKITAVSEDGEIMGIQHHKYQIWGVQFHPESILTQEGKRLINNFLSIKPD